jgi:hypothetical protein
MADFDDQLLHPTAGGPESDDLNITLHAPYLTETVQLPLTITFAELLLFAHQSEVRYGSTSSHRSCSKRSDQRVDFTAFLNLFSAPTSSMTPRLPSLALIVPPISVHRTD